MKIAVSGKGGVGKTTVSATLAKFFAENGYTVYAVDGDPDASLGGALGIPEDVLAKVVPVIELEEVIKEKSGGGAFYALNPQVDDVLDQYAIIQNNIKFLRMGGIKQGGTACYCRENTFLHAVVDALLLDKNEVVILDMGAGIEHLTRGTAKGVDMMLVVTEPSKTSVQTAKVVQKLAQDIGVNTIKVIGNKIRSAKEAQFLKDNFPHGELLGLIPFDDEVLDQALEGNGPEVLPGVFSTKMKELYLNILGQSI